MANLSESDFSSLVQRLAEPVARQVMEVVRERPGQRNTFQTAEEEVRNLFTRGRSGTRGDRRQVRGGTRQNNTEGRNRYTYTPYPTPTGKAIDVVLLPSADASMVIRGERKARLHREGFIIDKFFFRRQWGHEEVIRRLRETFRNKLDDGCPISFQILKPEGQFLVVPRLAHGERMTGSRVCDIFAQKTMYLRPEKDIEESMEDEDDDGDDECVLLPSVFDTPSTSASGPSSSALTSPEHVGTSASSSSQQSTAQSTSNPPRSCHVCTFINLAGANNCEMCEANLMSLGTAPSHNMNDTHSGPSVSIGEGKNPREFIHRFTTLLGFENKPANTIKVHRDALFADNVAFFKKSNFDAKTGPMRVHFEGEEGIDAGALLRENFRLLFQEIRSSAHNLFLETPSGKLLPSNNQFHVFSGLYTVIGKVIGTALLNNVPVELPLHKAVTSLILKLPHEVAYREVDKDDVMDVGLGDFITKMLNEPDEEKFKNLLVSEERESHWLDSCGWPVSQAMTMARKHDIALCLISHYVIGIRRDAIEALRSGVTMCIPNIHKVDRDGLCEMLACQPTTADELRQKVEDSVEELRRDNRSITYQRTVTFISRFFESLNEGEAKVVAIFATGTACISDITLKVSINNLRPDERSPIANACDCSILFPRGHTNYSSFRTTVLKRMKETGDRFLVF